MCKGRAVCARACRCKQARLLVADGAADGERVVLQAILRLHLRACIIDDDVLYDDHSAPNSSVPGTRAIR